MDDTTISPNVAGVPARPAAIEPEAATDKQPLNWKSVSINICAFAIAAASLIPHYREVLEAKTLGVPTDKVNQAQEQVHLRQENQDCFRHSSATPVKTVSNDQISVTVCPNTGDILLDVQPANPQLPHIARWVGLRHFEHNWAVASLGSSVAYAAESSKPLELAQALEILCQRMASPAMVVRKVRYSNGVCYEQQINAASGLVMSSAPTPCTPGC